MRQTLFIIIVVLITNFGFSQETNNIQNKSIDPKLVGCWKGSEVGQQKKGVSKYWISSLFGKK